MIRLLSFSSFLSFAILGSKSIIFIPSIDLFNLNNATTATCNDHDFAYCLKNFTRALGFPPLDQDAGLFLQEIQSIIEKYGQVGFQKICRAENTFVTCLGSADVEKACVSVANLQDHGLMLNASQLYASIFNALLYECSTGYSVLNANFKCVQNVSINEKKLLDSITMKYEQSVKQDPGNVCKYTQSFVQTYANVYGHGCSTSVGNVICETMDTSMQPFLPQCFITCSSEAS